MRPSKSVIWSFNRSYWRHLGAWDETFDRDYAAALPGGVSDGTNPDFWAAQIERCVQTLDRLDEWSELPEEIYVVEFGVGDGELTHADRVVRIRDGLIVADEATVSGGRTR